MNKTLQKELAIKCMEKLDIYKPYINKFKSSSMPCFYENFAGFWADQEPELWSKIKGVEKEHGCLVYAITHELSDLFEMWSMLCVPSDAEWVSEALDDCGGRYNDHYAFSYTWNKTYPQFSEFGDVVVRSFGGGIKRVH